MVRNSDVSASDDPGFSLDNRSSVEISTGARGSLAVCQEPATWDAFVARAADASLLQSWGWGALKARYGWQAVRYLWRDEGGTLAAISVLRRPLLGGLALHYAPRGPILDGHLDAWAAFWQALKGRLRAEGGTILKIDPEWTNPEQRAVLEASGARPSPLPIQHQATAVLDLQGDVIARVKESARRHMRHAERAGVTVQPATTPAAMDAFYPLLQQTGARQRFPVRPRRYYQDLLSVFSERDQIRVYLATHGGRPVAGTVMLTYGNRLVYLFGASNDTGRSLRAAYLLHQRAILDAQQRGCTLYDLWGVPVDPVQGHPGYGYYRFKIMFNPQIVRFIGLFDLPVRRPLAPIVRFAERVARVGAPDFV